MPMLSDILSSPNKVYLLHTKEAFTAFWNAPAAAKVILFYWENCGPCKTFTPTYLSLPAPRLPGDEPPLNADDIPIIMSTEKDIIYGAIERDKGDLLRHQVPSFPFSNGFPTMGLFRGTTGERPNEYIDKLLRHPIQVLYANIEALLPGTLDQQHPPIPNDIRETAKKIVPQLLQKWKQDADRARLGTPQQRGQPPTAASPNGVKQAGTGSAPESAAASASPAAQHGHSHHQHAHNVVNQKSGSNGPVGDDKYTDDDTKSGIASKDRTLPSVSAIRSSIILPFSVVDVQSLTETTWVHRFHPSFVESPSNIRASELIQTLKTQYKMPWARIPDDKSAQNGVATPTVTVYIRASNEPKRKLVEYKGVEALTFLSTMVSDFKKLGTAPAAAGKTGGAAPATATAATAAASPTPM